MPTESEFDLFVIGGGSGGIRAARMAAQRGARVAVAECGPLGGTCVNVGCIPKKLYSFAAHFSEAFEESHGFGWATGSAQFDWPTLKRNRAAEITRLNGIYAGLLSGSGVTLLHGRARVLGANDLELRVGEQRETYRAKNILVATGGQPVLPEATELPGRELAVTSDDIFDLPVFPKRLVVVGGGYIACEFASIFRGLGAEVTQLYRGEQVLRGFDADVRAFVAAEMRKKGVDLRLGADVTRLARTADGIQVHLRDGNELMADTVLYATGRRPHTAGLGLAEAGVALSASGAVMVDDEYRSSIPSISAVGDVIERVQLTPVALAEAMALVDRLFGEGRRRVDYTLIPTAVFTNPSIGCVGLNEADARAKFGKVRIFRADFRALKHTLSGSSERTLVKLIVDVASDRVVGLHMVGADAGEVVQGFAVAMRAGATKACFDSTIGIHPTMAEEFVTMREAVA